VSQTPTQIPWHRRYAETVATLAGQLRISNMTPKAEPNRRPAPRRLVIDVPADWLTRPRIRRSCRATIAERVLARQVEAGSEDQPDPEAA